MVALGRIERLQDLEPSLDEFRSAVIAGLSRQQKTLPCKFFYDREGSRLFDEICEQPEYYPTRTESLILEQCAGDIAQLLGPHVRLVEFGSGAGIKIRLLLRALDEPAAYVPVDISREQLLAAAKDLAADFPSVRVAPVCADYTKPFALPAIGDRRLRKTAGFFPGSTIGNFAAAEAIGFLTLTRRLLGPASLMIVGVDVPKDERTLHAAYNDGAGITAAFNLNLLQRINRELAGNIDVSSFVHDARWNQALSRVEMHLVSTRPQTLNIADHTFEFTAGETIHTENSYKYSLDRFRVLARDAGYAPLEAWTDEHGLFSVHVLRAQ
ncbi:MAG: L-histidine N(alpha)-methyltransferase [Bradyrhizobiaceae bacterium]|nr:L-histidine N(alpha)-methyltransferase [Bradyrhizobiaceae bacterium]